LGSADVGDIPVVGVLEAPGVVNVQPLHNSVKLTRAPKPRVDLRRPLWPIDAVQDRRGDAVEVSTDQQGATISREPVWEPAEEVAAVGRSVGRVEAGNGDRATTQAGIDPDKPPLIARAVYLHGVTKRR
jgi:hypothetical protein